MGSQSTLEHSPKPIHIFIYDFCIRRKLPANGIPLVDNEDEFLLFGLCYAEKVASQVVSLIDYNVGVGTMDIVLQLFVHGLYDSFILDTCNEVGNIQKDNWIFVQVLLKRWVTGNLQVSKQTARVT